MKFNPSDYIIVGIHGFNERDGGESTTDKLAEYYEKMGFKFIEFDIGYFDLLKVRFGSRKKAHELAKLINSTGKKAVVVCHSHGNVIADIAVKEFNANIVYHIAINPALNVNHEFHNSVQAIDVYFNQFDKVVTWGKRLRYVSPFRILTPLSKLKRWIPSFAAFKLHPWGEAGRYGFQNGDIRMVQLDTSEELSLVEVSGHSDIFRNRKLRHWGPYIAKKTVERLKTIEYAPLETKQQDFTLLAHSLQAYAYKNGYRPASQEITTNGLGIRMDVFKGPYKLSEKDLDPIIEYWQSQGGEYYNGVYNIPEFQRV